MNNPHPGVLLVLCGPSGVGKSTISRILTEKLNLRYVVSATTREKRPNDEQGKIYEYISQADFFSRIEKNQFLEYAPVHGNYYGTPKQPTLDWIAQGQDVLLEIDVQGALQVRYQYPDALLMFILPPSDETLLQRLTDRARDSAQEIQNRFHAAKREIWMAKGSGAFGKMIVNDSLDLAVSKIISIFEKKKKYLNF